MQAYHSQTSGYTGHSYSHSIQCDICQQSTVTDRTNSKQLDAHTSTEKDWYNSHEWNDNLSGRELQTGEQTKINFNKNHQSQNESS